MSKGSGLLSSVLGGLKSVVMAGANEEQEDVYSKIGVENKMYYDKEAKRWRERGGQGTFAFFCASNIVLLRVYSIMHA